MKNEYEIIPHKKIKHINILFTKIKYRAHHFHSDLELFCIVDGSAKVDIGQKSYQVKKGDILLINSDEVHEIDSQQGSICGLVVQISNHFLREYFSCFRTTIFSKHNLGKILNKEKMQDLWNLILDFSDNYIEQPEFYELETVAKVSALIKILLTEIPNEVKSEKDYLSQKKISARMHRIVSYIDENYSVKIKLSDIAKLENLTTTHLSHFFTQNFGVSFQQYLSAVRFEHALRLIINKSLSIVEVAFNSGFSDQKYLTEIFKEKYGCTAAEFRNKIEFKNEINHHIDLKALEQHYDKNESLALIKKFKRCSCK